MRLMIWAIELRFHVDIQGNRCSLPPVPGSDIRVIRVICILLWICFIGVWRGTLEGDG